jgi:rhodanese-related sulfurtransferase
MKGIAAVGSVAIMLGAISSVTWAEGNRYNLERFYHSEISAAQAYLEMKGAGHQRNHQGKLHKGRAKAVLIDVRSMEEYAAGHPEKSYNIPYPRVCVGCDPQPEATFYWEVYKTLKGDTESLIMTLCRTGSRSVKGGNILANPSAYGINGPAFTNVRNIWEGFVGQYKYAYDGGTIMLDTKGVPFSLDLDNSGDMDADTADVYVEREDKNPDKDGWRNFQALPWTTKIHKKLAYQQSPWLYEQLTLTPVD